MAETGDLFGALSETPTPKTPTPKTPTPQLGLLATVAVARPLDHPLDYLVPESLVDKLQVGQQVSVPLGPRSVMGFVVKIAKARTTPSTLTSAARGSSLATLAISRSIQA